MIVVCVGNGLGNQMFQYAFFLSMKKRYPNNKVYLDYQVVEENRHNGYELDNVFGIDEVQCPDGVIMLYADACGRKGVKYGIYRKMIKVKTALFGYKDSYLIQDDQTAYYEEYYNLSELKSYVLRGVWANYKYLELVDREIKEAFKFKKVSNKKNEECLNEIKNTNSVSIHIRKGDFKTYANGNLNILTKDYYMKALQIIKAEVDDPHFFVFSDDIVEARDELGLKDCTYIDWNVGKESYMDMFLMSKCNHNIIANSTFSFWGAYLNENDEKIVIAPSRSGIGLKNPIVCPEWHIIEV